MKLKYINRLCENSGIKNINSVTEDMLRREIGDYIDRDADYVHSLCFCLEKVTEGEPVISESGIEKIKQDIWIRTIGENRTEEEYMKALGKYHCLFDEDAEEIKETGEDDLDTLIAKDEIQKTCIQQESFSLDDAIPEQKDSEEAKEAVQTNIKEKSLDEDEFIMEPFIRETERKQIPVSVLEWVITLVLLGIPLVNIGTAVFFLTNRKTNESKRNYIIAALIMMVILLLISGVATAAWWVIIRNLM